MKLYECDNQNGAAIHLFANTKAEAREIILNKASPLWQELRKTEFSRDDWNTRMKVREIEPVAGVTCGVITY
ncbi:MAG: hypothetical protein EOP83_36350 [Verrucomicrobiaceae bacterium]|nr:MAG: hypothetical protein EOP83_36350 [Verrucomicrobiaceae bacterium]